MLSDADLASFPAPDDRDGTGDDAMAMAAGKVCRAVTALLAWGLAQATPVCADAPEAQWQQWRKQRANSLTGEESWTSLVGLHWLDTDDAWTVGAVADNGIVLANIPDHLGRIAHADGQWRFTPASGVEVTVAGVATAEPVILARDEPAAAQAPVRVRHGSVSFTVIQRGERAALRVWDRSAPARRQFAGLDYFPWHGDWRLQARWEPHQPARAIDIVDVTGQTQSLRNPGVIRFRYGDRDHQLEALQEADGDDLFVIFADRSNRTETYGAGRYLYTPAPAADGTVTLDFNYAFNPPCAFSGHATCPLPPPENRMDLHVLAGEKRYSAKP